MIKTLNDENFLQYITEINKKVVVDFYADWCGPCKMMAPVFDKIAEKYPDIEFCKINVDESTSTAQKYGVMSIPTFLIFKNGQPVNKRLGVITETEFEDFIK